MLMTHTNTEDNETKPSSSSLPEEQIIDPRPEGQMSRRDYVHPEMSNETAIASETLLDDDKDRDVRGNSLISVDYFDCMVHSSAHAHSFPAIVYLLLLYFSTE